MIYKDTVERLMALPNVVAVGEGFKAIKGIQTGLVSIVVSVSTKVPFAELDASARIPESVDNKPTDVIETGVIRALVGRTDYMRPVPGGVSCGHGKITAGTWGCLVVREGHVYGLSNNHVLANSNDAKIGDKIYQPRPYDIEGDVTDEYLIAHLTDFVPITFDASEPSECPVARFFVNWLNDIAYAFGRKTRIPEPVKQQTANLVDAAIARPVDLREVDANILGIGMLTGVGEVSLGDMVKKSGRTTGVTESTVTQINVTCRVQYGEGKTATFEDQVMAAAMSQPGDSGSAVLNSKNAFVGLLSAGSDSVTIFSRAGNVMKGLKLEGVVSGRNAGVV